MLAQYFQIPETDLKTKAVTDPRAAVAVDVALLQTIPALPGTWLGRRPRAGAETRKIIPIEAYWASDAKRHGAPNASAVMHDSLGPVSICSFIGITSIEEEDICIVLTW